ncbi:MAG: hypothetical protein EOO14_00355 [Chitinophagaceae bacterium]|nr:MAG: hypothetical protein EOO14_00355 [Chitinophagaceae bacterium]
MANLTNLTAARWPVFAVKGCRLALSFSLKFADGTPCTDYNPVHKISVSPSLAPAKTSTEGAGLTRNGSITKIEFDLALGAFKYRHWLHVHLPNGWELPVFSDLFDVSLPGEFNSTVRGATNKSFILPVTLSTESGEYTLVTDDTEQEISTDENDQSITTG